MSVSLVHAQSGRSSRLELDSDLDPANSVNSLYTAFGIDVRSHFGNVYHVVTLGAPAAHGRFLDVGDMLYGVTIVTGVDVSETGLSPLLDRGETIRALVWLGRVGTLSEVVLRRTNVSSRNQSPQYTDRMNLVSSPDPVLVLLYSALLRSASGRCLFVKSEWGRLGTVPEVHPLPDDVVPLSPEQTALLLGQELSSNGPAFCD